MLRLFFKTDRPPIAEVVLALLIQTFEFSHSGKEIAWRATGVSSPVVVGPEGKGCPEMPMMVNLVKKDL